MWCREKEKAVEQYILGMSDYLTERSPFNIRHTARACLMIMSFAEAAETFICLKRDRNRHVGHRRQGLRAAGLQPACGKSRERVRVYANGWYDVNFWGSDSPSGHGRKGASCQIHGFTAMKWDPFMRTPWRNVLTRKEEDGGTNV
jgi:hypothetical protein